MLQLYHNSESSALVRGLFVRIPSPPGLILPLLLFVFHQSFRVSLGLVERLTHVGWELGIFLGFVALWCLGLFRRFQSKVAQA